MAKYNILHEEEVSKNADDTKGAKYKDPSQINDDETAEFSPGPQNLQRTPGEEFFTDDIFSAMEADKARSPSNRVDREKESDLLSEENDISDMDFPSEQESERFESSEEKSIQNDFPQINAKTERPIYDYEDEYKQEGVNYKPILIGFSIVAVVAIVFFVVSNLFFSDEVAVPEEKIETAAEKLEKEQGERKQNILAQINKETNQKLSAIQLLTGLDRENVKYSSILLYGNSLDMEVFAANREALARFNVKIKSNPRIKKYKIETVVSRPGSQGGLFALYDLDLKNIEISESTISPQATLKSPESWEASLKQQAGLNIKDQRTISSKSEDLFTVNRNEYELRGSLNNCLSLLDSFASSNQNISVHKLSLLPTNQQKMSTSSYVLKLVVDYYL